MIDTEVPFISLEQSNTGVITASTSQAQKSPSKIQIHISNFVGTHLSKNTTNLPPPLPTYCKSLFLFPHALNNCLKLWFVFLLDALKSG